MLREAHIATLATKASNPGGARSRLRAILKYSSRLPSASGITARGASLRRLTGEAVARGLPVGGPVGGPRAPGSASQGVSFVNGMLETHGTLDLSVRELLWLVIRTVKKKHR